MKVLVATTEGQDVRGDDHCWALDGELVQLGFGYGAGEDHDEPSSCPQAFTGLSSGKCTTTALVADRPLTREDFLLAVAGAWQRDLGADIDDPEVRSIAADLLDLADQLPTGSILERAGDLISVRAIVADAG